MHVAAIALLLPAEPSRQRFFILNNAYARRSLVHSGFDLKYCNGINYAIIANTQTTGVLIKIADSSMLISRSITRCATDVGSIGHRIVWKASCHLRVPSARIIIEIKLITMKEEHMNMRFAYRDCRIIASINKNKFVNNNKGDLIILDEKK